MTMNDTQTVGRNRWNRPVVLLAAACVALGAGVLTGCGTSASAGTSTGTSDPAMGMPSGQATGAPPAGASSAGSGGMPATATTIMIEDFQYQTPASVSPGATVSVMNMDGEAHTVTSNQNGAFAVPVPAGKTVTFTAPADVGSYDFHCDYHSNMQGTLVVK
jgi:plastocyanin